MKSIFGLDFGTSNSALAINTAGSISILDIDPKNTQNSKILKSILFFDEDNKKIFYGQDAIDTYIDTGACGRYVQSVKSILKFRNIGSTIIFGKIYELDDLVSFLIKKIKDRGEEIVGEVVDDVVLGRPVFFAPDEEDDKLAESRLVQAAKKAGFKNIFLQYEPIAAALAYEKSLPQNKEKIVLIGDFGGGTSDFTVIKARGGEHLNITNRKNDIISIDGVNVAGDSFDSLIMQNKLLDYFGKDVRIRNMFRENEYSSVPIHLLREICLWHQVARMNTSKTRETLRRLLHLAEEKRPIENLKNYIENNCGYMLYRSIEKTKIELSDKENSVILFDQYGIQMNDKITRKEFEQLTEFSFQQIEDCVSSVIKKAGLNKSDIEAIFLTGGTSHVPRLRKFFVINFPQAQIDLSDAFTSVVYGLGLQGDLYQ